MILEAAVISLSLCRSGKHKIEPNHFSMEPNVAILKLDCGERKHDFEEKSSLQVNCHEVLVKITNQAALMYGIKGRLLCNKRRLEKNWRYQ